ncbi:uncharacterized protein DUF2628 [Luteibacter rhizovicinus]|uniref:Uncharacterized protein DUF2628 n=1 Tax=Luteibacter rhizovicinus TaxID=242606 RepID=A0A4R3YSK3_9GAMM|nr:DUF2628 domain-containing protein [Luteibacter rhizovicinus]TCV95975.1 uncharacterized protein DUF2628 [Luteibacter rhizovicinus]
MATVDYRSDPKISEKWKARFAFFDQFGAPNTPEYKAELKTLPFGKKILINTNIWAFFFGPIAMAVMGIWRKALSLLGIIIAVSIVLAVLNVPDAATRGVGVAFGFMCAICTNYAVYLKKVKGQDGWNPFEGMRL